MSEISDGTRVTPTGFSMPVAETLPEVVQRIVQALQPDKIVLFGSYADGIPTSDSDVDLLVVVETTAPPVERYLAVSRLLRPRPFPVDILVKRPDEIQSALEAGDLFMREVLSKGQVLYERER